MASYLLFYIAKNHCFTDGNKRVAWAVAVRVLRDDGLKINAGQDEAAAMVNDVVTGILDLDLVLEWFGTDGRLTAEMPSSEATGP
jgi:death on curing protein